MVSTQPRKQRYALYNLPPRENRAQIASHLSQELQEKYRRRAITVRKGDTVKVLRGDFKGIQGKVLNVNTRTRTVTIDGVTLETAKHAQKPRPVAPSNLLITKLDLTDPRRRAKLGAGEADVAEEDRAKPKMDKRAPKPEAEEKAEKEEP